jgi:translation elongation factor EF-Ts
LTSREALIHPFFKEYFEQEQADQPKLPKPQEIVTQPERESQTSKYVKKAIAKTPEKISITKRHSIQELDKRHSIKVPSYLHLHEKDHNDNSDSYSVVSNTSTNVSLGKQYAQHVPRKRLSKSKLTYSTSKSKVLSILM